MNDFYVINPLEYLFDDEERWTSMEASSHAGRFESEETLDDARDSCRQLALTNEFAINGHENRISFVVGSGHTFRVVPKPGRDVTPDALQHVQDCVDEFIAENRWYERQQEIMRRKDRDGEAFLRLFIDQRGKTTVRFIEPDLVRNPQPGTEDDFDRDETPTRFGIQTAPHDIEQVLGYRVDGEWVPAREIQHRKANVDANVLRGVPLFYPVRKNLRRAEKLLRNMSVVAEIQSAIAIIRKHNTGNRLGIERFAANAADAQRPGRSGTSTLMQRYQPGTILDTSAGVEYEFPVAAVDASRYILVLQAELRAIASRLVMPEFMLTSDASNANYSSTMIAEGPAVRMFARLQREMMEEDTRLFKTVLQNASIFGRISPITVQNVTLQITAPNLSVHDRLRDVQADRILFELGILSANQLAARHGAELLRSR